MKALYIQIHHIVSIKVIDKTENTFYTYGNKVVKNKTYKSWLHKLFGIYKTSNVAQVYHEFTEMQYDGYVLKPIPVSIEEITDRGYLVEGFKVYYKPRVTFCLSNKQTYSQDFNSMKELNLFLNPIIQKNKELIKLIDNELPV